MRTGDVVRVDFPGHVAHGQRVRVVEIIADFNLAPEGAEPLLAEVIFVQHPSWPGPCSLPRARISGTIENAQLRVVESVNDARQGALVL